MRNYNLPDSKKFKKSNKKKSYGKKLSVSLNEKKFRNELKRKRKKKRGRKRRVPSDFQLRQLSNKSYSSFIRFMNKNTEYDYEPDNSLSVPEKLSFVKEFQKTMLFFKDLHNLLYKIDDNIVVDFKRCKYLSLGSAT